MFESGRYLFDDISRLSLNKFNRRDLYILWAWFRKFCPYSSISERERFVIFFSSVRGNCNFRVTRRLTVIPVSTVEQVGPTIRLEAFTRMEIGLESYNCKSSLVFLFLPSLSATFPGISRYRFSCLPLGVVLSYHLLQSLYNVWCKVKLSHSDREKSRWDFFYFVSSMIPCACSHVSNSTLFIRFKFIIENSIYKR